MNGKQKKKRKRNVMLRRTRLYNSPRNERFLFFSVIYFPFDIYFSRTSFCSCSFFLLLKYIWRRNKQRKKKFKMKEEEKKNEAVQFDNVLSHWHSMLRAKDIEWEEQNKKKTAKTYFHVQFLRTNHFFFFAFVLLLTKQTRKIFEISTFNYVADEILFVFFIDFCLYFTRVNFNKKICFWSSFSMIRRRNWLIMTELKNY